jgi:tetratricopeptide (TPR) repeat protein
MSDLRAQLQAHLGDAFRIERELGGGGMSRVFLATEVRLARTVAVKVLSPELAQGINAERFEREILLAASLQQANIVPLLAAGDLDGLPYFTMPFVEGESLRRRLTSGGLPIADVIAILRDVTKALAYAHARGIVHRDIKPDNVLLSGGTAVVTDFGIAKALSASRAEVGGGTLTSVGTSIGTPAYMAPEQVAGDPTVDHRVDLYALGCMAHELLTGASPFADRTPQKMLAAHLSETPASVTQKRGDCPPALATLVKQLLEKDPADRIGSATEVLRTLDAVTGSSSAPSMSLSGPGGFAKAFGMYVLATAAVAIVAKAAVVGIGLPEWTFPGAVGIMLLGLPVLLLTGYAKSVARRNARATPTLTPGGTMVGRAPSGTLATIALKANPHLSWRRNLRYGMVAMGGFVLLVTGYMVTRQLGVGPAASLFATGTLAAEDKVLLADFTTSAADSSLAPIVQAAVRAAMSQSRAVRLLTPTDVAGVLTQMQRPITTPLDPVVAREVATRSAAKAILGGRLAAASSGYLVSLELISTADGTPLASYQGTADGVKDLLDVVDDLTKKLRGKMGESLKQVQEAVPLARATTSNLEALKLYTEASVANDIEADYDKSIALLRRALALDPTFALAWRKLNASLVNNSGPIASRDSALDNAARYADKLPPLERLMVQGAVAMAHSTKSDRGKALEAYRAAYALDSSDMVSANQLMLLYERRGERDSSLRYARRKVAIAPVPSNRIRVLEGLGLAGRVEEAQLVADSLRIEEPAFAASPYFRYQLAALLYSRGEADSSRAMLERIASGPASAFAMGSVYSLAEIELARGKIGSAVARRAAADSLLVSRGSTARIEGVTEASIDIRFRGRLADGIARLDRILAGPQWAAAPETDRPYVPLIVLYGEAGAPAKARQLLGRLQADRPEWSRSPANRWQLSLLEGYVALAERNYPEALRHLRAGAVAEDGAAVECQVCLHYGLAQAFDLAGSPDSARVHYEALLALPPLQRMTQEFEGSRLAQVRKRLGELYDSKGDRAKAMQYYAAFVEQWREADAELQPTVATVKRRLTELRAQEK